MLHCSPHTLCKGHEGRVAKLLLGLPAAVVVVSAGQGHSHGGEGRLDGHHWVEEEAEEVEEESQPVHQPVGQPAGGGLVAELSQHLGNKVPEGKGSIISDVVCLRGGGGGRGGHAQELLVRLLTI